MVSINIQKRDLWFLSTIVVLLVGVGFVIAYGSGDSTVHGHDAGEINTYDSGWFAVTGDTTYTKAHGLGNLPFIVQLWVSDTSDGSGRVVSGTVVGGIDGKGMNIVDVDNTNIKIRTHSWIVSVYDANGVQWAPDNAYAKIKAMA